MTIPRWWLTTLVMAMLLLSTAPMAHAHAEEIVEHPTPTCNADRTNWTMGLVYCSEGATLGYTLFSPIPSNTTYLIDHEGRELHSWSSPGEHRPGLSAYLLPDGDLLRTANIAQDAIGNFSGGGTAGKVERIAWEERTEEEALQAGRNPAIASDSPGGQNNVWPDQIIEVKPVGADDAEIVWRWHAWDHLIQDYDETKENYGVVAEHPELLNINYVGGTGNQAGRADWMHCNGIDYNAVLDQIALSCKSMNEIYIIDHSTTTEEAAGHVGGNAGKGGDFLYRWGNPQVYHHGLSSDQQLFGQHDVQWIEAATLMKEASSSSTTETGDTLRIHRLKSSTRRCKTGRMCCRQTVPLDRTSPTGPGTRVKPCIRDLYLGLRRYQTETCL